MVKLRKNGEGNGNPLQCFCLENPKGSRAWWAATYGVARSRTRLKRLGSSSSIERKQKSGCQVSEGGKNREKLVKGYKLSATSSEDVMYNMVTTHDNAVLYN